MSAFDTASPISHEGSTTHGHAQAPGKRTLTQGLQKKPTTLKDEQREVVDFDTRTSEDGFYDARGTVDAKLTVNLSAHQLSTAKRKNLKWSKKLAFDTSALSSADPGSAEFALDVATKQQALGGLKVDGIAGPKTVEAITGIAQGMVDADEDRFAQDDPFGMHLIG